MNRSTTHRLHALAAALALAALIAGCVSVPPQPLPVSENAAVIALVDSARGDDGAGHHAEAAATLERALRIEPRNPRLWQELARVRLNEGSYVQAETLAGRSSSWAGSDNRLRAENWRIIAAARRGRGDTAGAQAATERADKLDR